MPDTRTPKSVLFLDLDGTVRKGKDELGRFVNIAADVEVFPQARKRMAEWRSAGGRIIGVTNQAGVALGHLSYDDCADAIRETMRQAPSFDYVVACTHGLDDGCMCRKPGYGALAMGLGVLHDRHPGEKYPYDQMLMVGDRPEDEQAAAAAGVQFAWADEWRAGTR